MQNERSSRRSNRSFLAALLPAFLLLQSGTQGCRLIGQLLGGGAIGGLPPGGNGGTALNPGAGLPPAGGFPPGGFGPSAPQNTPQLPAPGTGSPPPPAGAGQRPQVTPAELQDAVNILAQKHGIRVRGSYNQRDLANALTYAKCYYPQETYGLTYNFTANRRSSGVLGVWSDGNCSIYSSMFDVVAHEGAHHITLFGRNRRSRQIGEQLYREAVRLGGGRPAESTITRSYARTQKAEFLAELCTAGLMLEKGLNLQFTVQNRAFNPPASIRQILRTLYNPQPS